MTRPALIAIYAALLVASGAFLATQVHRAFVPEVTPAPKAFVVTLGAPLPQVEAAVDVKEVPVAPPPTSVSNMTVRERVRLATVKAFGADQWPAMEQVIMHESSFDYSAVNPSSGAFGLCQALPKEKMASAGPDYLTNPTTQIQWCITYVQNRYTNPANAWRFWQLHHWF